MLTSNQKGTGCDGDTKDRAGFARMPYNVETGRQGWGSSTAWIRDLGRQGSDFCTTRVLSRMRARKACGVMLALFTVTYDLSSTTGCGFFVFLDQTISSAKDFKSHVCTTHLDLCPVSGSKTAPHNC